VVLGIDLKSRKGLYLGPFAIQKMWPARLPMRNTQQLHTYIALSCICWPCLGRQGYCVQIHYRVSIA
jgi:hypothetical protein